MAKRKTKKRVTKRKKWRTTETVTRTTRRVSLAGSVGSSRRRLVIATAGLTAVAAAVGGVLLYSGSAQAAGPGPLQRPDTETPPAPPLPQGPTQAEKDAQDAATASTVFGVSLTAANSIVAATVSPAALVYTGPASAAVGATWAALSTTDKAHAWRGETQSRGGGGRVAGLGDLGAIISPGAVNLVNWIVSELKKQIRKMGQIVCGHIDYVVSRLRSQGAKLPKSIDSWSCDQKVAFVAAMTPWGVAAVLTGALTGALATNTAAEVERNLEKAKNAVKSLSQKLGISVPSFEIGGTAGSVIKKYTGLGLVDLVETTGSTGGRPDNNRLTVRTRRRW